jgi:membrane protein
MATATERRNARKRRNAGRRRSARAELPAAIGELVGSFRQRKLMVWSSALSFQIVTAIVPFLLFAFGLIGFLSLDNVWADIAKNIRPQMSGAAFTVINQTAHKVLTQQQLWWVTVGFGLAIWQVSGGIRAIMGGLSEIYGLKDRRGWFERTTRSILIALIVSALVLAAIALTWAGPLVYGNVGQPLGALFGLLRWGLAALLLGVATGLTVRLAPDGYQPAGWVTEGTIVVVGSWIVASLVFGLYIRFVASYGSIFGNLATIVVLLAYIYISSIVFFAGAQVDAIIRRRVEGNPQGR